MRFSASTEYKLLGPNMLHPDQRKNRLNTIAVQPQVIWTQAAPPRSHELACTTRYLLRIDSSPANLNVR